MVFRKFNKIAMKLKKIHKLCLKCLELNSHQREEDLKFT